MEGKGKIKSEEQKRINRDQLLTVGDFEIFRIELIQEISGLLKNALGSPAKKWLKSTEVKKLLAISTGTLQTLRMNGTLSHSKMGGTIYHQDLLWCDPFFVIPAFTFCKSYNTVFIYDTLGNSTLSLTATVVLLIIAILPKLFKR